MATILAFTTPERAQTVTKPNSNTAPDGAHTSPAPAKSSFPAGGVWHHFGEKDRATGAAQSQPSSRPWLGQNTTPPVARVSPGATSPRQNFRTNHSAELEAQMWMLLNQDRSRADVFDETNGRAQPLKWNERLAVVARAHSRKMLEQGFFSHVEPDGRSFSMRINETGIAWEASGENIAIYDSVQGAEAAFMNEPRFQRNHRANILNNTYTEVGIGVVQGPDGSLYITQDFVATAPQSGGAKGAL